MRFAAVALGLSFAVTPVVFAQGPALKPGADRAVVERAAFCTTVMNRMSFAAAKGSPEQTEFDRQSKVWFAQMDGAAADNSASVDLLVEAEMKLAQRYISQRISSDADGHRMVEAAGEECAAEIAGVSGNG